MKKEIKNYKYYKVYNSFIISGEPVCIPFKILFCDVLYFFLTFFKFSLSCCSTSSPLNALYKIACGKVSVLAFRDLYCSSIVSALENKPSTRRTISCCSFIEWILKLNLLNPLCNYHLSSFSCRLFWLFLCVVGL